MTLEGYSILVERSHWVNEELLYRPDLHGQILERLSFLIHNPDHPSFLQRSNLKRIRRIRMGDVRVYARLHPAARVLTILAVVARGKVKRDEKSGALDFDFVYYLTAHSEDFLADRFRPLEAPRTEEPVVGQEEQVDQELVEWGYRVMDVITLSEEKAMQMLDASRPARGSGATFRLSPFAEQVAQRVERSMGDRVIVELPPKDMGVWEKEEIKTLQRDINKTLKFFNYQYSVRFDELAQKFLLVPPDKVDIYCYGRTAGGKTVLQR